MSESTLSRSRNTDIFPAVPADLIEALERVFPEKSPTLKESVDDLRDRGGRSHVVRFLRRKYEEQNSVSEQEA